MTVSFFGHRIVAEDIRIVLQEILIHLIENKGADIFYVGNHGGFDRIVRKILRGLKVYYPHIQYSVVLAYMPIKRKDDEGCDDDTIFPEGFENNHPKYAIVARNKWMLDRADMLVTYVKDRSGGAAFLKN